MASDEFLNVSVNNLSVNSTQATQHMSASQGIAASLVVCIFIACIIGNTMMCVVIFRDRLPRRSPTYTLLGNIAIADLGMGLCCIPFTIITMFGGDWILGEAFCNVNGFMNAFWIPVTVFSTTSVSVHKYLTMHDPFNPARTWTRLKCFVLVTWVTSCICAVGPLLGWSNYAYKSGSTQCGLAPASSNVDLSYLIFLAVNVYIIPMGLNVFSFIKLFAAIRRHSGRIGQNAIITQATSSVEKRAAITFLMVFLSYVLSWTPFFAYGVLLLIGVKGNLSGKYLTASYVLGFSNTVHNPIIFAFRNKSFRNSFKEIFLSILSRHRRKFRTITNASNFSLQFFTKSSYDLSSTWYLDGEQNGFVDSEAGGERGLSAGCRHIETTSL